MRIKPTSCSIDRKLCSQGRVNGATPGSLKTIEQKREEYKEAINLLKKGYSIRDVAKLTRKGVSNIQRMKEMFL